MTAILERRCALAIAHPGHELRIFGWLLQNRPLVSVLTDGTGQRNQPRIAETARLLENAGCRTTSIFGNHSDRWLYERVLRIDCGVFQAIAQKLADSWIRHRIDCVLADAAEGTIMAHDLWRAVVDRAIEIVNHTTGIKALSLSFSLECDPRQAPLTSHTIHSHVVLDEEAFRKKLIAAVGYQALRGEVERAFQLWGRDSLRHEIILEQFDMREPQIASEKPAYEIHGEQLVRQGIYEQVVRYSRHVKPIVENLKGKAA